MKRMAWVLAVVALLTSAAMAQSGTFITASVPFAFFAGETRMPAGEYRISYYGPSGDILVIANHKSGEVVGIMSYREGSANRDANPKLVFHNYREGYFLARVLMANREMRELPQTRTEREFSAQARPDEITVVARLNK